MENVLHTVHMQHYVPIQQMTDVNRWKKFIKNEEKSLSHFKSSLDSDAIIIIIINVFHTYCVYGMRCRPPVIQCINDT